jgi:hypothetical protein
MKSFLMSGGNYIKIIPSGKMNKAANHVDFGGIA